MNDGAAIKYITARYKILGPFTKFWLKLSKFPNYSQLETSVTTPDGRVQMVKELCKENEKACIYIDDNTESRNIIKKDTKIRVFNPQTCQFEQ